MSLDLPTRKGTPVPIRPIRAQWLASKVAPLTTMLNCRSTVLGSPSGPTLDPGSALLWTTTPVAVIDTCSPATTSMPESVQLCVLGTETFKGGGTTWIATVE